MLVILVVTLTLCITAFLLRAAWRANLFLPLSVVERSFGPFVLLYKNVTGQYHECPLHCKRLSDAVVDDARLVQVHACKSYVSIMLDLVTISTQAAEKDEIGSVNFFYDDPQTKKPSKCRYSVGYASHVGFKGGAFGTQMHVISNFI